MLLLIVLSYYYYYYYRVLPSQVSYGWIGWVGVGIKYSKPFVCICKHTAYGGAAKLKVGWFPPGECFLALGFALLPVSYSFQSRQRHQPDPRTLNEYTPRQYWSANFILLPVLLSANFIYESLCESES